MAHEDDLLTPPNLDDVLHEHAGSGAWLIRLALLALSLVVIIAWIALPYAGRLHELQPAPETTYHLYVTSNVPWATVTMTLQGARSSQHLSLAQSATQPSTVLTQSGQHSQVLLHVIAPPFIGRECTLSVPPQLDDTCLGMQGVHPLTAGLRINTSDSHALNVDFPFTVHDLPPDQESAVMSLVDDALTAITITVAVPVGSHYSQGSVLGSKIFVAAQPLLAILTTRRVSAADVPVGTCADICSPATFFPHAHDTPVWHVRVFVRQRWEYHSVDGGGTVGITNESLVPQVVDFDLRYIPNTQHWEVPTDDILRTAINTTVCLDGNEFIGALFYEMPFIAYARVPLSTILPGARCLFQLTPKAGSGPRAIFLWRFGQMYAANAVAQNTDAQLPVAGASDLVGFEAASFTFRRLLP